MLKVGHFVSATAYLVARPSVGGCPVFMQAEIAFPGNGHAQSPMSKHFYLYRTAGRPGDSFAYYLVVYFFYLMEIEFPGKDYDICKPGIEAQGL